jgi:hypothetical protein
VRVESDCLLLIRVVQEQHATHAAWASILAEIRAVKQLHPECTMHHICREANAVAHVS